MTLTASRARELFTYNPATGDLTRRISVRGYRAGGIAGTAKVNGYRGVIADGRGYLVHRLAWLMETGEWPANDIDHINGDRADNRWENLREATRSQNNGNMRLRKDNSSGFKGVCFHPQSGKWRAVIWAKGRRHHIGLFATPKAAHDAYMDEAKRHFGEFARAA